MERVSEISAVNQKMFCMPYSIYPYANYLRYGSTSNFFRLFLASGCLFTRYFDSIQICFNTINKEAIEQVVDYIDKNNIRMISGPSKIIKSIFVSLGRGRIENGFIFELEQFDLGFKPTNIKLAKTSTEFCKIAKLVCEANSANTSFYTPKQYYDQIFDRYLEGYCRNWVYSINHQIVGHVATYAETPFYCVIGGLAVDSSFRGQGIAKKLLSHSISNIGDHRKVYAFCFNDNLRTFYKKISNSSYPASKILLK